jgi:uncharacterized OB-fold protein
MDPIRPDVSPNPEGAPFWAALAEHRLDLPWCVDCDAAFLYPRVLCPACGSRDVVWRTASGRGTLHSFCVLTRPAVPGLREAGPLATGLIELAEGPRVLAFLRDFPEDPELIGCDVPVRAAYVDVPDGATLLAFEPAG